MILVWSHLNLLIRNHDLEMIYVVGPGHGAPAALASLWLEGSLEKFYPGEYDRTTEGLRNLITRFSVPGGFPRCVEAGINASRSKQSLKVLCLQLSVTSTPKHPDLSMRVASSVTPSPCRLARSWTTPISS